MKTVIITGGSSGLGKSLAIEFSKLNYNIILASRNLELLLEIKKQINCSVFKCDVSNINDVSNLLKFVLSEYNKIDIIVNNAGVLCGGFYTQSSIR